MTKSKWHQVKYRRFKNMKDLLQGWSESNEIEKSDTATILDDVLFEGVCTKEFWSGLRSVSTLGKPYSKCCKQHRYPRKLSLIELINWMTPDTTFEEWEQEILKYLVHDLTTREENRRLIPFQKAGVFTTPGQTYIDAEIELISDPKFKPQYVGL